MKNALIFFLMAVMGLGLASRGEAAFRISGLRCVRSMPDQEPCSKTAPQATAPQASTGGSAASGQGYVLSGTVRSAASHVPVGKARIEVWQAVKGQSDNVPRTMVFSEESGKYHIEGNYSGGAVNEAPEMYLRVSAPGYKTLVTEYRPAAGQRAGSLDLVLAPAGKEHAS